MPSPLLLVVFTILFVTKHFFLTSLEKAWQPPTRSVGLPELPMSVIQLEKENYTFIGQDYPLRWPSTPLNVVHALTERTSLHYRLNDTTSDAEWDALTPSDGIIHLGPHNQPFSISMMHQLRCLNILRKAVLAGAGEANSNVVGAVPPPESSLVHHCINYLRQTLLCRSTMDADSIMGKSKPNAFPDIYKCRDWDAVYDEIRENQRLHSAGVGPSGP